MALTGAAVESSGSPGVAATLPPMAGALADFIVGQVIPFAGGWTTTTG
jgi:hypothetical protein